MFVKKYAVMKGGGVHEVMVLDSAVRVLQLGKVSKVNTAKTIFGLKPGEGAGIIGSIDKGDYFIMPQEVARSEDGRIDLEVGKPIRVFSPFFQTLTDIERIVEEIPEESLLQIW